MLNICKVVNLSIFLREEQTSFSPPAKIIDHKVQNADYQLLQFRSLILNII